MSSIRTVDGRFDDYMKWRDTTLKQQQETARKDGYIVSYEMRIVDPRGASDPDILLVITYRNRAALDGVLAKVDAIAKQMKRSVQAANRCEAARAAMRRVLGSTTLQLAQLR